MAEPLFPVSRVHLEELSDATGIWQHARGSEPDARYGYCTDDVARCLQVDLMHARTIGWEAVAQNAWRCLRFLRAAFDPRLGRFHNFRSANGSWLDRVGSEDSQARASLALAEAMAVQDLRFRQEAAELFGDALPGTEKLGSLRPVAAAVLSCVAATRAGEDDASRAALLSLAGRLGALFEAADDEWPWPEDVVTYENGLPPRALIVAGGLLGEQRLVALGLRSLDWLSRAERNGFGNLAPVGNAGWWARGGQPARFDQQPIEATSILLAAADAFEQTHDPAYRDLADAAYDWFLGANDAGMALCNPLRGSCQDGLTRSGTNTNQGAESTLMWLMALERTRELRAEGRLAVAAGARAGGKL